MAAQNLKMGTTEWVLLLTLSVLWGGAFVFAEIALEQLPPLTIVLARVGIGALALAGLLQLLRKPLPTSLATWRKLYCLAFLNNVVPFSLIVWGQSSISAGLASILNATTPLFAVIFAHVLTRDERLQPNKVLGVVVGVIGVGVLVGPDALADRSRGLLGQLAVLAAAVSYGLSAVYARRLAGVPPLSIATGQLIASTTMMVPLAILIDRPWQLTAPSAEVWWALVGLAVLSTALAYILYFQIIARAGGTNGALVTLLIPISAMCLGALMLGETVTMAELIGASIIGIALLAIDGRLPQLIRDMLGARRLRNSTPDVR